MKETRAVRSIIFVCLGNTCRSAIAEGLARAALGGDILIASAGLEAGEGCPAMADAVTAMRERGLDISAHRTRSVENAHVDAFDRVVAMEPNVAARLRECYGVPGPRLIELDVADPYGRGIDAYRRAVDSILGHIHAKLLGEDRT